MNNDEIFFTMALTRISNFNYATALELYRTVGSAQLIFEHRHEIGDILQDCSPRLMEALKDWDEPMKRAEAELQYMQTHGIRALTLTDEDYPQRLSECSDAPIVLYYKGNADLNQSRIISIVGTRHCTTYGQDIIRLPQWECWLTDSTRSIHIVIAIRRQRCSVRGDCSQSS